MNRLLNYSVALTFSPCVSLAFLLTVGIELTANQCQSVRCAFEAGVAGEEAPRCIFPAVVGKPKHGAMMPGPVLNAATSSVLSVSQNAQENPIYWGRNRQERLLFGRGSGIKAWCADIVIPGLGLN